MTKEEAQILLHDYRMSILNHNLCNFGEFVELHNRLMEELIRKPTLEDHEARIKELETFLPMLNAIRFGPSSK
jgi:hypothetical protein